MKRVILRKKEVYSGSLILVNRAYGYKANNGPDIPQTDSKRSLIPVLDKEPEILMQRRAAVLLFHLMDKINGWQGIVPVSGWRSGKEQEEIWDSSLKENGREFTETYVAFPGHSEHQTGLAIDLGQKQEVIDFIRPEFPYTGICGIFRERAADYGFIERYPKGREDVTGIGYEPWHFRYVGIPHAKIMEREKLTLEEYIALLREFPYGEKSYRFREGGQEFLVSYLKMPDMEAGINATIELDDSHPYWVSGNNVDGFVITQERGRYGY